MKKEIFAGQLSEEEDNEVIISVNDEDVSDHFVFDLALLSKNKNFSFVASKDVVRDFLKAILDES